MEINSSNALAVIRGVIHPSSQPHHLVKFTTAFVVKLTTELKFSKMTPTSFNHSKRAVIHHISSIFLPNFSHAFLRPREIHLTKFYYFIKVFKLEFILRS